MRRLAPIIAVLAIWLPGVAEAHSAGSLDPHGCHSDRRRSSDAYHCHRGPYNGLRFRSKADMIDKKKAGVSASDIRGATAGLEDGPVDTEVASPPAEQADEERGLLGWLTGDKDEDSRQPAQVGTGTSIVPKGIEARLRTLKDLHSQGLITDEEYEQKRRDILGDL